MDGHKFPPTTFWKGNSLEEDGCRTSRFQGEFCDESKWKSVKITGNVCRKAVQLMVFDPCMWKSQIYRNLRPLTVFFLPKAMKAMKIDEAAAMKGCLQALKALVLTLSQLYSQILAVFRAISTVNVESFLSHDKARCLTYLHKV